MKQHLRDRIEQVFDMAVGSQADAKGLQSWRRDLERIIDPDKAVREDITRLFNDFGA